MVITSLENNKIKELVKLQKKKNRDKTNTFIAEGLHLVNEAIKENIVIELFALEGENIEYNFAVTYVSAEVMKKITSLNSIPTVVALCKKTILNKLLAIKYYY